MAQHIGKMFRKATFRSPGVYEVFALNALTCKWILDLNAQPWFRISVSVVFSKLAILYWH